MIHSIRGYVLPALAALSLALALGGLSLPALWLGLWISVPLVLLGIYDLLQPSHNVLRNYPVLGHLRFLLEDFGPELRQYFVENNTGGAPFNRDQRSLFYQRAKDVIDKKPFGTELNLYAMGYTWIKHSMRPKTPVENPSQSLRVDVGTDACERPYSASILNISAMSFGALSANAIAALNRGARMGGFSHNTGEGGLSRHHLEPGGDLVWQIGTGYFGCRSPEGGFDPDRFSENAARNSVKMIELKISQGAKPGHGGVLPAAKVSAEIANARGVPQGRECISPSYHSAFETPIQMLEFIAKLRELSGGKPVGFKLCVGDFREFFSVCKAMLETQLLPDFVTVDGAEGGTGAAPIEFSDRLGVPLKDGLHFVHNALVGIGVRDRLRIIASGKTTSAFEISAAMALGADLCNTARGFMFAMGCIQAQSCHTNKCPVGIATQNPYLQRALVVRDKAQRVANFHRNTVEALAEFIAAAGLEHTDELAPQHLYQRTSETEIRSFDRIYDFFEPGQLLDDRADEFLQPYWDAALASSFDPR
jgi:glutamate synthase domain-containing protein 2